ncbi:MAG: hypothetical protein IKB38_07225 [Clostridia bacterium]|nr:hypothetical protein [Clostridia bacterium]
MKKISIDTIKHTNRSCDIIVNNVGRCEDVLNKICEAFGCFFDGEELFLGLYKIDGFYLKNKEKEIYANDIESYFKSRGLFCPLLEYDTSHKHKNEFVVCKAPNDIITYKMLHKVFKYHLETIVFSPKNIVWNEFVESYKNYNKGVTRSYVLNGYTDFLLSYIDSGDFVVSFDSNNYDAQIILNKVKKIIEM